VNWIRLAHNRAQWRAFVNTVMNLYLPEKRWKMHKNFTRSNDRLHSLNSSPNMRWAGHVARMGGRSVYRVLVGRSEETTGKT
jgi:hypothetical protein